LPFGPPMGAAAGLRRDWGPQSGLF